MTQLKDEIRSVVEAFMKNDELFTALDVSNKVKLALPFARHSEVRDEVRALFLTDIEPEGWARSPIPVTLPNGRQETALLYHPLSASWDLDKMYDAQKRAQASFKPGTPPTTQLPQAVAGATSTSQFGWCGTPPPGPSTAAQAAGVAVPPIPGLPVPVRAHPMPKIVPATPAPAPAKVLPFHSQWNQLFGSQPSLFPRK